jgi:hypothetical protein
MQPAGTGVVPEPPPPPAQTELKIVSHSNLFYWWPVWAVGFLMGILSLIDNQRMVVVPPDAKIIRAEDVGIPSETLHKRDVIVMEKDKRLLDDEGKPLHQPLVTTSSKSYGVIWAVTLVLVIVVTNVPMRGLWSLLVLVTVSLLTIIFWLAGWWEHIFHVLFFLDIHINTAGYFFISGLLFGIWLLTFLFFDRQQYIIFSPGSVRVCTTFGGGETAYDSSGLRFEKQRSDLFRHWILGLGSGDLIVKTTGAGIEHFDLPNVLFIGRKVEMIEHMIREKAVVGRR